MPSLKNVRRLPKPFIFFFVSLIKCLSYTFRLKIVDPNNFLKREPINPVIYAFWHNRLIGTSPLAKKYGREKIAVLISQSRDGQYIADVIEAFGFYTIRGSSSKGGAKAVRDIQESITGKRCSIAITLDGPRGPKYTVHRGAVWLASRTQIPIIPIGVNTRCHWQLKSWDQTQIPKPFTKTEFIIGNPIHVNYNLKNDGIKDYQTLLYNKLLEITHWD